MVFPQGFALHIAKLLAFPLFTLWKRKLKYYEEREGIWLPTTKCGWIIQLPTGLLIQEVKSLNTPTFENLTGNGSRAGRASCRFLRLVEKPKIKVRGPPHRSPSHH